MSRLVRDVQLDQETASTVGGLAALAIAFALLISGRAQDLLPTNTRLLLVLLWPAALAALWLTRRPEPVVFYVVLGGLLLRVSDFPPGGAGPSDVLAATNEGIHTFLHGGNPYTHFYESTVPPGTPFLYPPAELFVHLPGYLAGGLGGVQATQVAAAMGTLALFAWVGAEVSWLASLPAMALYAGAPNLVNLSVDGSNDTGVGFTVVAALIAVAWALDRDTNGRAFLIAGLFGGLAVGMKQTAAPIVFAVAVYVWRTQGRPAFSRYAGGVVGLFALVSVPLFLIGPLTYLKGLVRFATDQHTDVFGWNIWAFAQGEGWGVAGKGLATALSLTATAAAAAVVIALPYRRLAEAAAAGIVLTLILLLTVRWTTYAYFAVLEPTLLLLPALALWDSRRDRISVERTLARPTHEGVGSTTAT